MAKSLRIIVAGGAIGALVAGALAIPAVLPALATEGPGAAIRTTAHDLFTAPSQLDGLKKFDLEVDDTVSDEPEHVEMVRKIAFGRVTAVRIVTTSSGTYSSDALASGHVRYPGVTVNGPDRNPGYRVSMWSGQSWVLIRAGDARSITTLTRIPGGTLRTRN